MAWLLRRVFVAGAVPQGKRCRIQGHRRGRDFQQLLPLEKNSRATLAAIAAFRLQRPESNRDPPHESLQIEGSHFPGERRRGEPDLRHQGASVDPDMNRLADRRPPIVMRPENHRVRLERTKLPARRQNDIAGAVFQFERCDYKYCPRISGSTIRAALRDAYFAISGPRRSRKPLGDDIAACCTRCELRLAFHDAGHDSRVSLVHLQ